MAEEINLEKMTATELRDYALKNHPDITGVTAMKKEDLVTAIRRARGEEVKEVHKKKGKGRTRVPKSEIKKQIRGLKSEREKILQAKDAKGLARLRKKIKRLKRLTKRAA